MKMIYYLIISLVLLFICYLAGTGLKRIIKGITPINSIIVGLMFLISLFYFTALPFMYMCGRAGILFFIYSVEIFIVVLFSGYHYVKNREYKNISVKKNFSAIEVTTLILIIWHIARFFFMRHTDIDDSFYIAQTNTILKSNLINPYEPSTGISLFQFQNQYKMVGHEIMYAYLCSVFKVNAAVLYHTVMPVFLLPVHYIISFLLAKTINKEKSWLILLCIVLLNSVSGYSVYSSGAFTLIRIWQGKAVLVSIIMPFILYVFINIFNNKKITAKDNVMIFLGLTGGIYASAVGVYVIALTCAMYAVTYCISIRKKEQLLNFLLILIPAVLILPVAGLIYKVIISGADVNTITEGAENLVYMDVIRKICGNGFVVGLYIIAAVYMLFSKNRVLKYLFGIYSIVCFVTLLNPLFAGFIAAHITGTEVYWRLFWMLQINICIAVCISDIYGKKNKKVFAVAGMLLILLSGRIIFGEAYFIKSQNYEKISEVSKNVSDAVITHYNNDGYNRLLISEPDCFEVREYTGETQLAWSRYSNYHYNKNNRLDGITTVYETIYTDNRWDNSFAAVLKDYGINYVVFNKNINNISGITESDMFSETIWENDQVFLVYFDKEKAT